MIPAIDLLGSRAVFLVGGRRETAEVVSGDPVALALEWQRRGAKRLHVVDLDAALGSGENRDVVKAILRAVTIPVQVGGGLRDEDGLRDVLSSGASKAIVGTRAIRDPDWLRSMAVRFPSRLILALDRDARGLLLEGWQRSAAADPLQLIDLANALPLDGVLFTNVAVEGRLQGVGPATDDLVLRCSRPRIAAGGVTDRRDVEALRRAGYDHVVVGKALYAGTLDLEETQEAIP
ncbi:MAG: 1-(5-phosphoribosyl)-5-[(5-phosphoribosylamino)methylideneamino] imidazole-4-carboxamide isomerase [Thermoplasmata archaeon]